MKILVIDSNGMIGHVVSLYLKEQGHSVFGYADSDLGLVPTIIGSLLDMNKIKETIEADRYDAVINCSAVLNQDAEEDKALASYINAFLPHYLEKMTEGTTTVVIHRSTDCIFSGKQGGYTIKDIPDAESFYARTKAIGEVTNKKDITIRTSLIGPEMDEKGQSLFNWFFNQAGEVRGYKNAIWTGMTTIEFAKEIERLLVLKAHGLFQLVPENSISKFELLECFNREFKGARKIIPVDNERVDKSLVKEVNGYPIDIPSYSDMISEMSSWIKEHKELYKHYV